MRACERAFDRYAQKKSRRLAAQELTGRRQMSGREPLGDPANQIQGKV